MSEKIPYREQFKDPRWQRRRLEILKGADFTCVECGNTMDEFHVHHRYYVPERMVWEYPDFALLAVCHICHEKEHQTVKSIHFLEQWLDLIEQKGLKQETLLQFVEALYASKYDPHCVLQKLTDDVKNDTLPLDKSLLKENSF